MGSDELRLGRDRDLAPIGALLGHRARAAMLTALADGRALPAGELARHARIAPATATAHLRQLVDSGLVRVRSQGRHRYHELAGPDVAAALEAIARIAPPAANRHPTLLMNPLPVPVDERSTARLRPAQPARRRGRARHRLGILCRLLRGRAPCVVVRGGCGLRERHEAVRSVAVRLPPPPVIRHNCPK